MKKEKRKKERKLEKKKKERKKGRKLDLTFVTNTFFKIVL